MYWFSSVMDINFMLGLLNIILNYFIKELSFLRLFLTWRTEYLLGFCSNTGTDPKPYKCRSDYWFLRAL